MALPKDRDELRTQVLDVLFQKTLALLWLHRRVSSKHGRR